jgi:SAM-dependent methyltransferase
MTPAGIFTGERLVANDPLFAADMARHLFAYRWAQERGRGRVVLDAGCGDGYGTHMLAATAASAVGVDRNPGTVEVARGRYQQPNLAYRVCDLTALTGLGETFEVVCNFQVLEHLDDPLPFLRQVREVLRPGGELILTTPNRLMTVIEIPYHVHEYAPAELAEVLGGVFPRVEVRGVRGDERAMAYEHSRIANAQRILRLDPLNLRRFVPRTLIEAVYPYLAKTVRRGIQKEQGGATPVTEANFSLAENPGDSLDLLAVCRP